MNSYTVAEVGRRPGAVLAETEPSIITNNGKAQNLIINVLDMEVDEVVHLAQAINGQLALSALRRSGDVAARAGITEEDIEAEVAAVRAAR